MNIGDNSELHRWVFHVKAAFRIEGHLMPVPGDVVRLTFRQ
jgi:hypothetical protein